MTLANNAVVKLIASAALGAVLLTPAYSAMAMAAKPTHNRVNCPMKSSDMKGMDKAAVNKSDCQIKTAQMGGQHRMAHHKMTSADMAKMRMPMEQTNVQHGNAVPIGSLPVSDGAAPRDYGAYGVTLHMKEDPILTKVQFDSIETTADHVGRSQSWEGRVWVGNSYNKVLFRTEGSRSQGNIDEGDIEALWGHAVSPFWDVVMGVRHDLGDGPSRNWAAIGIQGTAPYEYEVDATLYAGPSGRSAIRVKASQDWLFTQKLIMTPGIDVNAYTKNDRSRAIGSGLADIALSLRLRYEIRREFAPYIGITWQQSVGNTADYLKAKGQSSHDTQWVLGVRVWW